VKAVRPLGLPPLGSGNYLNIKVLFHLRDVRNEHSARCSMIGRAFDLKLFKVVCDDGAGLNAELVPEMAHQRLLKESAA